MDLLVFSNVRFAPMIILGHRTPKVMMTIISLCLRAIMLLLAWSPALPVTARPQVSC